MKILYFEGNSTLGSINVSRGVKDLLKNVVCVSNLDDGLYNIAYTEMEFDIVMIGDELDFCQDFSKHLVEEMHGLNGCKYFPVEFGKVCIELCKKSNKKIPKIVIFTTMNYYLFNNAYVCSEQDLERVKEYVEDNNMQLINKSSEDFYESLQNLISSLDTKN